MNAQEFDTPIPQASFAIDHSPIIQAANRHDELKGIIASKLQNETDNANYQMQVMQGTISNSLDKRLQKPAKSLENIKNVISTNIRQSIRPFVVQGADFGIMPPIPGLVNNPSLPKGFGLTTRCRPGRLPHTIPEGARDRISKLWLHNSQQCWTTLLDVFTEVQGQPQDNNQDDWILVDTYSSWGRAELGQLLGQSGLIKPDELVNGVRSQKVRIENTLLDFTQSQYQGTPDLSFWYSLPLLYFVGSQGGNN
jgi:hypothetical protein